jgi:rSAM/selenodomain-associated transferase 2
MISVVIPALNEADRLPLLLADLAADGGLIAEVIVVDGGSADATCRVARLAGARVLSAPPGRGGQLVAGIAQASSPWLWLLHADARLPRGWHGRLQPLLQAANADPEALRAWYGRLRVQLPGPQYRLLEWAVRLRSRYGQRPYGDQSLLLSRWCLDQVGGIRPLPLMEDLEFAQRLARCGRFESLDLPVQVDGRRWQRLGLVGALRANAALRRAWRRGASVQDLHRRYQGAYQKAQRRPWGSSSQPCPE